MNRRHFLHSTAAASTAVALPGCLSTGNISPYPTGNASSSGGRVLLGIDRLAQDGFTALRGQRVALITNQTSINGSGTAVRRVLQNALGPRLVKLLTPEHGLDSRVRAGVHVATVRDSVTGLIAHSLYGAHRKPTREMLADVDVVVFDVQDIGCRSYTYISTMAVAMEACGEMGKGFLVLDRPNPLGGQRVQGPPIERRWKSFVGQVPVPYVHGLTAGELAKMIVGQGWGSASPQLMVVPMLGWSRGMSWGNTGLPWVATSPNIPYTTSPLYYATTGMLGGMSAVDIGIGTSKPFQFAGGRNINGAQMASDLTRYGLPGIQFRPYQSANKPGFSGVELNIQPNGNTDLCAVGVMLIQEVAKRTGGEPLRATSGSMLDLFHKVYGSNSLWTDLQRGRPWQDIAASWQSSLSSFQSQRQPYLLYS
jgi:uncharacterized protein YbbC (DUF1343 family)